MISLQPETQSPPLRRPWKNAIAVGRAYDLLRVDLQEHLAWLQREIGFRSCRFHALFHDDMAVVRRGPDGRLVYQWHHIDKVYDFLLSIGLRPFVELNPMPAVLASGEQTMFHYRMNVTPPHDWAEWFDLVQNFTRHCVERYGLPEVRQWHFEVWNEPNLSAFWSGTKEEYFRLYAEAARAVKSVDPELRVGGPATAGANWLADLINYCHTHHVPLDFLSTHLYPQDEFTLYANRAESPFGVGEFFTQRVRGARETINNSPLPHLPIHWTEWNTQLATSNADVTWGANRHVDSLHGASFIARHMVELDDAADTFTYWVASDIFEEGPIPNAPFSQTYGLLTIHGLPKAHAHAFRFLEALRGPRIVMDISSAPPFCGGVGTREGDSVRVLLWNDAPPEVPAPLTWTDVLRIPSLHPTHVTTRQITAEAGSPFEAWEKAGRPLNLTPIQLAAIRSAAEPRSNISLIQPLDGQIRIPIELKPNEVLLVEFTPQANEPLRDASTDAAILEAQLGEKPKS